MTVKQNVGHLTCNLTRFCQYALFGLLLVHACHGKKGGSGGSAGNSTSTRDTGASSEDERQVQLWIMRIKVGGDTPCTLDQLESIYSCTTLMEEEMTKISPETKEIVNLTSLLSENNKANFFTQGLIQSFSIGKRSSLEHGPRQVNISEIAEILRTHRNESREIIQATCRGINRFVNCSKQSIKESDCNPRSYRMTKAMGEAVCNEDFQETMINKHDCVIVKIQDPQVAKCLGNGTNDSQVMFMQVILDPSKKAIDVKCALFASTLQCFRAALQECGSQVYEQYARMVVTGFSPFFNVECDVDAVVSGELAYIITDDGDVHMKNRTESAAADGGNVQIPESANDSNEPLIED